MRFYTHTSRSGQTMHRLMRALIRRVAAMGPTRQNVHLVVEQGDCPRYLVAPSWDAAERLISLFIGRAERSAYC